MHKQGMFNNIDNNIYHQEDGFISSSALSLIIDDPIRYYRKYIKKDLKQEQKNCFDVGNAFHTYFLEPEKYKDEFIFCEKNKASKEYKALLADNPGKTIITGNKSKLEIDILIEGINKSKKAIELLEGGKSEVSIYFKLAGFPSKVRFDKLNLERSFGIDLKSTTGDLIGSKGKLHCQSMIAQRSYDLSAAYYLDTINALFTKLKKPIIKDWYWIFASKDFPQARIFKASPLMLENGRKKYKLAIELIDKYEKLNWSFENFEDKIEDIDPLSTDLIEGDSKERIASW